MQHVAFLFPGQETQYLGMGKDLIEIREECLEIYDRASEVLGYDLKKTCFDGPADILSRREISQAAIITTSLALMTLMQREGIQAGWVAGFSLGEYTALTAARVVCLEDALKIVRMRLQFIQEAVQNKKGAMVAIIGLGKNSLLAALENAREEGVVEIANYNSPEQVVITGDAGAVKKARQLCKELGARRAVLLPIDVPFHSSLIQNASHKLEIELSKIEIKKPEHKILSNYQAREIRDKNDVLEILPKQLCNPVQWEQVIRTMISRGVNTFIEIGPKDTLTRFVQAIGDTVDEKVHTFNVENADSLQKLQNALGAVNP